MTESGKKIGRPLKTLKDLPKDWKEKVIEIGEQGGSGVEMMDYLNISDYLWYKWLKNEGKDPELEIFSEVVNIAKRKCQVWWERAGREGCYMGGKHNPFNSIVWIFNMKNRFGWADKIETSANLSIHEELKDLSDKLPD